MSEGPSKESDIPVLSHIVSSLERHITHVALVTIGPAQYPQGLGF